MFHVLPIGFQTGGGQCCRSGESLKGLVAQWGAGWCSGDSTRLPPTWRGFDSQSPRRMWVELVVGSLLGLRGFLQVLRFSPLKN